MRGTLLLLLLAAGAAAEGGSRARVVLPMVRDAVPVLGGGWSARSGPEPTVPVRSPFAWPESAPVVELPVVRRPSGARCPAGMASVDDRFCIDRWEATVVDLDTGRPASPYYVPSADGWPSAGWQHDYWARRPAANGAPIPVLPSYQRQASFQPMAVSQPGVYPQGFATKAAAANACANAGKRLCRREEWYQACAGPSAEPRGYRATFPYGETYEGGRCNFNVGGVHPLVTLGRSSSQLDDPRLMLVKTGGRRMLAPTGDFQGCESPYGVFDMVGNQDEIVDDPPGGTMVFVGSFYGRDQRGRPQGCGSVIGGHAEGYTDYSIGFRCCSDPQ